MRYWTVLGFLFLVVSCRTVKPEAPEIVIGSTDVLTKQPTSYIQIPIKIDLRPYFKETNKSVPYDFSGADKACDGVSVKYKFKREDIQFKGEGKNLNFEVNGKYALSLNYCPSCTDLFGSGASCVIPRIYASCGIGEPMRKMHVAFSTTIGMSANYKLTSRTNLKSVKALSPCKVSVFQYNATERVEKEVSKALKEVEKDIDKEISSVSLKKEMQETWDLLLDPIDLEGYGYFCLNPKGISVSKINYNGNFAHFTAVLESKPQVLLTKPEKTKSVLPKMSPYKKRNGFNIITDIKADYDSLSSILTASISGMELELKGKQVIFGDIAIHGAADKMLSIQVDFSGKKKGTLYLKGTPVFDPATQNISFPDLTFDVKTKSLLLKSAKWLFDKKITEAIRVAANLDLSPHLDTLKVELDKSINMELSKGVLMSGKMKKVTIENIVPMKDYLFIRGKGTGHLKLEM
jgi:hypothetical protein